MGHTVWYDWGNQRQCTCRLSLALGQRQLDDKRQPSGGDKSSSGQLCCNVSNDRVCVVR